jgi:hypothetical protein
MKTPVEQFAIALYEGGYLQGNGDKIQNLLEQHLEMEKEQIVNAFKEGVEIPYIEISFFYAKHYYDLTYGGNK